MNTYNHTNYLYLFDYQTNKFLCYILNDLKLISVKKRNNSNFDKSFISFTKDAVPIVNFEIKYSDSNKVIDNSRDFIVKSNKSSQWYPLKFDGNNINIEGDFIDHCNKYDL